MNRKEFLVSLRDVLANYLNGIVTGKQMVAGYERMMVDDMPADLETKSEVFKFLDRFQNEFELYVENPTWRSEHHSYYGDHELRAKAIALHDLISRELENR